MRRSGLWAAVTTVLSVVLVACGGSEVGPTTETPDSTQNIDAPTILRIGITGAFAEAQLALFGDTVADLSNGDMVIEFAEEWAITATEADVEQQIVGAVASGAIDLGWVGTRAFAELGMTSFDALTAPFLIDSYALQEAVLSSDIPGRMLANIGDPQLTGLAVIGGGLRRPIAVGGPLRNPDDFVGLTFHGWHSSVGSATIEALGADYSGVAGRARDAGLEDGTIDGFENTTLFFEGKLGLVTTITANVAFWPGTGVLIANSERLMALSEAQMALLRQAVSETVKQSVALVNVDGSLISEICSGGGRFAIASPADIADLREAVQTVYGELGGTEDTAAYIAEIEALKRGLSDELPEIPADCLAN